MIINHNITSLNTLNKLASNNNSVSKSLEKTVFRVCGSNRAGDDCSGIGDLRKKCAARSAASTKPSRQFPGRDIPHSDG